MTTDTIIAGVALALALYGIYSTNRHNRLSVTPHLVGSIHTDWNDDGLVVSYDLSNHGIGPAKIVSFTLYLDRKQFPTDRRDPTEAWVLTAVGDSLTHKVRKSSFRAPVTAFSLVKIITSLKFFFPDCVVTKVAEWNNCSTGWTFELNMNRFTGCVTRTTLGTPRVRLGRAYNRWM